MSARNRKNHGFGNHRTPRIQLNLLGQIWPGAGTELAQRWDRSGPGRKNDVKTGPYPVSRTRHSTIAHLTLKNMGKALICSLLRYVWEKYEAGTADGPLPARSTSRSGRKRPEYRMAQGAIPPRRGPLFGGLTALLLSLNPALAEGWPSSQSLDAREAERLREAHAARVGTATATGASASGWGTAVKSSTRSSDWVALDAFERSFPSKARPSARTFRLPSGSPRDQLLALIAFAESPGAGYDAVHHAAKIPPTKPPSRLTLSEIFDWIENTPGQPHAIGRFQIIPSTLARLQDRLGLASARTFSPATQDRMADILLADAGYQAFRSGKITRAQFMDRLAHIWAGLPLASGLSAYHGHAGNRATISRAFYAHHMARIFPDAHRAAGPRRAQTRPTVSKRAGPASSWTPLGKARSQPASD